MREVFFFIKVWYFGGRCKLNSGEETMTVEPVIKDRKMMVGNIAGVAFIFMLAFAGVWVAVDKLWCWLLNWCH